MKTITKNTRITALIAAILIASFAPQYTWAMAPAASRTALTTQLPARLAAQRAAQLAPTLYPAAARLGAAAGFGGMPAQNQQNLESRNQQLAKERSFERARARTEQWRAQAKDTQARREAERLRNRTWTQRAASPRTMGTGIMRPASSSLGGSTLAKPGTSRAFSALTTSKESPRSVALVRAETQQIIDDSEQRLTQIIEWISNNTLREKEAMSIYARRGKKTLLKNWLHSQPPPEIEAIGDIFWFNNNWELRVRDFDRPAHYSPEQIKAMRAFLAGLLTGESTITDMSKDEYQFKKGKGWVRSYYSTFEDKYVIGDRINPTLSWEADIELPSALERAAGLTRITAHQPDLELQLLAKTFINDPDRAIDILTAWNAIATKHPPKGVFLNTKTGKPIMKKGPDFWYEDTKEKRKTWNWQYKQEAEEEVLGKTAHQKYKAEQENARKKSRTQSQQQSSRGDKQSGPQSPLQAKFDADLADFEAGKKSYVDMVKAWHPDPEQDPELKAFKTEKMKVINSARK